MMSMARLDALVHELAGIEWDVVVLSETWRPDQHEDLRLDCGHRFFGSGGCDRSCGVGFLVHKRHAMLNSLQSAQGTQPFIGVWAVVVFVFLVSIF